MFELQTPDFARKFVWTVPTNFVISCDLQFLHACRSRWYFRHGIIIDDDDDNDNDYDDNDEVKNVNNLVIFEVQKHLSLRKIIFLVKFKN